VGESLTEREGVCFLVGMRHLIMSTLLSWKWPEGNRAIAEKEEWLV